MKRRSTVHRIASVAGSGLLLGVGSTVVTATEPCGDFGECKAIIEINSTDGDIGFHWLVDGDDLNSIRIDDPDGEKVFENKAFGPLRDQKLTETFGESAEPVCRETLKEDEDDVVVTLEDFEDTWASGTYDISGGGDGGEKLSGETQLTYFLPAAPENLTFAGNTLSWTPGSTLGECATEAELNQLVADGVLPIHPMLVPLASWEAVFELEDASKLKFTVGLPVGQTSVTLPAEFLNMIPDNTPAKAEIGAIGGDLSIGDADNATFTELTDLCLNETGGGCPAGD
jgi:hypothetical protein